MSTDVSAIPRPSSAPARTPWGVLAAIDLAGCPTARLTDADVIRGFVAELVPAIGMRAHGPTLVERFGDGDLEGWSAMQFIETSSVTVHADEFGGRCFVDVFSCCSFDTGLAAAIAQRWFGGVAHVTALVRGGRHPTP